MQRFDCKVIAESGAWQTESKLMFDQTTYTPNPWLMQPRVWRHGATTRLRVALSKVAYASVVGILIRRPEDE